MVGTHLDLYLVTLLSGTLYHAVFFGVSKVSTQLHETWWYQDSCYYWWRILNSVLNLFLYPICMLILVCLVLHDERIVSSLLYM